MGRFLSFGRSPKPAAAAPAETPGTPENLQLDELLLFSEDSLPVSLLKHNPDNQSRALKMFQSVLQVRWVGILVDVISCGCLSVLGKGGSCVVLLAGAC